MLLASEAPKVIGGSLADADGIKGVIARLTNSAPTTATVRRRLRRRREPRRSSAKDAALARCDEAPVARLETRMTSIGWPTPSPRGQSWPPRRAWPRRTEIASETAWTTERGAGCRLATKTIIVKRGAPNAHSGVPAHASGSAGTGSAPALDLEGADRPASPAAWCPWPAFGATRWRVEPSAIWDNSQGSGCGGLWAEYAGFF